jgi:hypothetical protein
MSRALIVLDTEFQRRKAADWVWSLKHGTRVEFKAPKRTDDQNSLMWVLLTKMSVSLKWHGRHLTPDDWKLQFLDALRRAKNEELRIVPNIDNTGFVNLSTSSSDLSKEEMSDLIELIYKFGAEHGVELGEQEPQSDAPTSEGSDGDAPRPNTPDVAAAPIEPAEAADQEAGEPEADHGDTAAPASDLITPADRDWLKQTARMLWAATGVGEQDVLKNQMAGIRDNLTPAGISKAARDKANTINAKCKLVCFGEASAADTLALIAGIAGCEAKDITT